MMFFFASERKFKYLFAIGTSYLFVVASCLSSIVPPTPTATTKSVGAPTPSAPVTPPVVKDNENHHHHDLLSSSLDKFHQWADQRGIERKVQIQYDTTGDFGGGRELIALERLEPGDVAVKVPLDATIRLIELSSTAAAIENGDDDDDDDNWAGILAAKLHAENLQQDDSKFVHYIANLPTDAPFTPCRWNTQKQQLLQNETFVNVIAENNEWRKRQVMNQNVDSNHVTDFLKWLDFVCSRTLKGGGGSRRGDGGGKSVSRQLVPIIDIANHAPTEAGGGYFVVNDDSVSLMVGSRGVDPGQPVTLDYGSRNIDDFLLHYGFVPQRCVSDSITIKIPTRHNDEGDDEQEEEIVTISWNDIRGYNGHDRQDVRDACLRMLQSYPTTLEEDVAKLNSNSFTTGSGDEAEKMALAYRYAKKSLLKSAVGISQQQQEEGQQSSAFFSSSFAFFVS